jgi:hypothetical protein
MAPYFIEYFIKLVPVLIRYFLSLMEITVPAYSRPSDLDPGLLRQHDLFLQFLTYRTYLLQFAEKLIFLFGPCLDPFSYRDIPAYLLSGCRGISGGLPAFRFCGILRSAQRRPPVLSLPASPVLLCLYPVCRCCLCPKHLPDICS